MKLRFMAGFALFLALVSCVAAEKGDNWKGDYHEAMLIAEGFRLSGLKKGENE